MTRKPKKQWEQHHTATLYRLNALGRDDIEIARVTGHSVKTVRRHREAAGLPAWYAVRYGEWGGMTAEARDGIAALCKAA